MAAIPHDFKRRILMAARSPLQQAFLLILIAITIAGFAAQQKNSTASLSPRGESDLLKLQADDPLVPPLIIDDTDTTSDPRAHFHPHGDQICASGCAASRHPTETLTIERFKKLAVEFDNSNVNGDQDCLMALETLLYFGPQTRRMLDRFPRVISGKNRLALTEQLKTTHARISIRVVDEFGTIRSWIPPTRVPFDRRHVFEMESINLQPHVASGTVKRVGIDRLWTRL
jgi:hypothetical protein